MSSKEPMETPAVEGDPFGFSLEFKDWSREKVEELARRNKVGELTDTHWKIIHFVHEYYLQNGTGPPVVKIAKSCGLTSDEICGKLFPCGFVRGAYLLAGLPRPAGCI
jgi:dissimilatory sulfite reductase related protein